MYQEKSDFRTWLALLTKTSTLSNGRVTTTTSENVLRPGIVKIGTSAGEIDEVEVVGSLVYRARLHKRLCV